MNVIEAANVTEELRTIKDMAVAASDRNDRSFYDAYLADDAVAILPAGVMDKSQVLAAMVGERAPFAAKRIEDEKITVLDRDTGVITYCAVYDRSGGEVEVMTTTICQRRDGAWKGVLYQQTPLRS